MDGKEFVDLVQKHMIPWAETEDSQLWNKRIDALIELIQKAEGKKNESQNGEG